jgi:hypothetical protein
MKPPFRPDLFSPPGYPVYLAAVLKLSAGAMRAVVVSHIILELLTLLILYRLAIKVKAPSLLVLVICPLVIGPVTSRVPVSWTA